MTNRYFLVDPADFHIHTDAKCDLVEQAIARYMDRLFVQDCSRLDAKLKGKHLFHKTSATFTHDQNYLGLLKNVTLKFNGVCEKFPYVSKMFY